MASFNKCILIGNLTADPELKQSQSGISVCSFSIAVNRKYNKDGSNEVDFFTIVAWRQQAEFVCKYFRKGKPIVVCGQIQTRTWTDKDGNKRVVTEVVADEVTFAGNSESGTEAKNEAPAYMPNAYQSAKFEEIPADEGLPF